MNIADRYIGIWVTRDEVEAIFGFDPVSTARVFLIVGRVLGEAPGIGLWIQLENVSVGGGPVDLFPDLPKERPRRLIRWDYIRAAELFDEKLELERVVGFRPYAAAA